MSFENYINERGLILRDNPNTPFSKMSVDNILIAMLNHLSNITTGLTRRKINFKCLEYLDSSHPESEELRINYTLSNGGEYQYNHITVKDYRLVKVNGDGGSYIEKLFMLLHSMNLELLEMYYRVSQKVPNMYYILNKLTDSDKHSQMVRPQMMETSKSTFKKLKALCDIHQCILMNYEVHEIEPVLKAMFKAWEIDRFGVDSKELKVYGRFSTDTIPDLLRNTRKEFIIFPDMGRGSLCSNFLVVTNMEKIKFEENSIITLKNTRKGSKAKDYRLLEENYDNLIAVENLSTGLVEFLANIYTVENAYSDLFTCNRIEFKGWYNRRVALVKKSSKSN